MVIIEYIHKISYIQRVMRRRTYIYLCRILSNMTNNNERGEDSNMKIGVCDVNPAETARTVFMLSSQLRNLKENSRNTESNLKSYGTKEQGGCLHNKHIGFNKVTIAPYTPDSVMLDLDDQKFDCDIFISELSFPNGKNGVKLADKINDSVPSCNIIFYTNKIPDELDIYDARHVNCMLKGRHDARLVTFVDKLMDELLRDERKRFVKIRYDRNVNILDCRDIMYIRIENRVTKYYTTKKTEKSDGVLYEYKPLSEIVEELPDNFVRCSAAVVVNKDYVKGYNRQMVTMIDGEKVKVGRRYGDNMADL